ncbi:MAG: UDP-N-acetylmuramoylalanyl-D-glutamyl-2,6-diaminopimelate--D-alanyl-D-alanine ligase [Rhodospirillales bacterium]|jgi:UDP-N-acetylmuramoyl-tripeptide--D-alanyl-D-alanine ligase|nr:UDP-N-acetylmuramoylalanyl-D-glutamyl-2,6-diaminopimelate--D-alanyl-D-alanine ligase [Rhodospirillales bacterium]MBT4040362.1 UDP-N-acetylmuramoylalanyl-D-glutamyl-2,6-diaminopimelate--D-alanyl-D-alanine ligase [Rhodospirillales bacterium]MBT4627603.1 UDP-N-acetylmuramoylalanyl-D-glutamyl-2,6-diaminopimelate--D-alanyl-D-alanine ligase [Rhodospirillales bacterium]MBT5351284.1 UDP-N-acetylmuramoylalanyl-D-glutamyl-2,6-diaminopimelate--D-alanyl-D-alanine ligase [Rhodospirillales bacterium]MBT55
MTMHPVLWSSDDAVLATGGEARGNWQATGVSINTRTLESGDLFFALPGPNFDGHDFANEALKRDASAIVISHEVGDCGTDTPSLIVNDTLGALEDLARASRDRMSGKIIAVTGSVGKTSTKEMLRLVLSDQGVISASQGNLNNHWGLPLSLSRMPADTDFGLFELGMNSPDEIRPLSKMARPHVAIITAVESVHIEFFNSVEEIADAKAEIFEGVVEGGHVVINRDSPYFDRLSAAADQCGVTNVHSFGNHEKAWARLVTVALEDRYSTVVASIDDETYRYRIGAPGAHLVKNSIAVLAAVHLAGGDVVAAAERFTEYSPLKGRGNSATIKLETGDAVVINESYNASPASMRAALAVLGRMHPSGEGRRIAVIGDMLELGPQTSEEHIALLEPLQSSDVNLVFTCGQHTQDLWDVLPEPMRGGHSISPDKLAMVLATAIQPDDIIVVKGSLGSKVSIIVDALLALNTNSQTTGEI